METTNIIKLTEKGKIKAREINNYINDISTAFNVIIGIFFYLFKQPLFFI